MVSLVFSVTVVMRLPISCKTIVNHRKTAIKYGNIRILECGPMPNVVAALSDIGGAVCES